MMTLEFKRSVQPAVFGSRSVYRSATRSSCPTTKTGRLRVRRLPATAGQGHGRKVVNMGRLCGPRLLPVDWRTCSLLRRVAKIVVFAGRLLNYVMLIYKSRSRRLLGLRPLVSRGR